MFQQVSKLCFKIKSLTEISDSKVRVYVCIYTHYPYISKSFLAPASEFMFYYLLLKPVKIGSK